MSSAPSLHQAQDQEKVDAGFDSLLKMADSGDMTAAAYLGDSCRYKHLGHYDLEMCRQYLEMSVTTGNPQGQFFLGSMLMTGEAPFKEDKVYGKWLLEEAKRMLERDFVKNQNWK